MYIRDHSFLSPSPRLPPGIIPGFFSENNRYIAVNVILVCRHYAARKRTWQRQMHEASLWKPIVYARAAIIGRDASRSILFRFSGFATAGANGGYMWRRNMCIGYTQANKSRGSDQEARHVAYSKALRMHPFLLLQYRVLPSFSTNYMSNVTALEVF